MSDLGTDLKRAVAHYAVVDTPPLEDLVGVVRRRRRRIQVAGAAFTSCAVLVGGILLVSPLGPGGTPIGDSQGSPSGARYFTVPTSTWTPGQHHPLLSILDGELRFTDDGCPYTYHPDSSPMPIAFPKGSRGLEDENGVRSVVDATGKVYATEHEQIPNLGGGATLSYDVVDACDVPGDRETFIVTADLSR